MLNDFFEKIIFYFSLKLQDEIIRLNKLYNGLEDQIEKKNNQLKDVKKKFDYDEINCF